MWRMGLSGSWREGEGKRGTGGWDKEGAGMRFDRLLRLLPLMSSFLLLCLPSSHPQEHCPPVPHHARPDALPRGALAQRRGAAGGRHPLRLPHGPRQGEPPAFPSLECRDEACSCTGQRGAVHYSRPIFACASTRPAHTPVAPSLLTFLLPTLPPPAQPHDHVVVLQRVHEDFCVKIVGVSESGMGILRIQTLGDF